MTEIVTGTPSIVGFTSGHSHGCGNYGYGNGYGNGYGHGYNGGYNNGYGYDRGNGSGGNSFQFLGGNDRDRDCDRGHGYCPQPGLTDKDQATVQDYAAQVDAAERTRDVIDGQRHSDQLVTKGFTDTTVAIEKTGAASVLSSEVSGYRSLLAAEKNASDLRIQAEHLHQVNSSQVARFQIEQTQYLSDIRLEQQKQACEIEAKLAACCCAIEEKIATLSARMEAIDAQRVRDDLSQARAELLALRHASNGNNGNSGRS